MYLTCKDEVLAAVAVEVSDRGAGRSPPLMLLAQLGASSSAAAAAAASAPMGPGAAVAAASGLQGCSSVSVTSCAETGGGGGAHLRRGQQGGQGAAGQLRCSYMACILCSSWCASHEDTSVRGGSVDDWTQLLTEVACLHALVTSLQPTQQQNGAAHDRQHGERLPHLIRMVGPSLAATRGPPPLAPPGLASQLASRTSRGDRGRTLSLD